MTPITTEEKYADKIAKLLRKAEDTSGPEAEAFVSKAQELMSQYAISEALIAKARGENEKAAEAIVQKRLTFTGIYKEALMDIGYAIVNSNDCRGVYWKREARKSFTALRPFVQDGVEYLEGEKVPKRPAACVLEVTGFESDIRRVEMLNASLQIQATSAQLTWWRNREPEVSWMSGMQKFKERREFLYGFAGGLRTQLAAARRKGQEAARQEEEARLKDSGTSAAAAKQESSDSVALVIRSKKQQVNDFVDASYGKLRSSSSRRSTGTGAARGAGDAAGRSADAGTTGRVAGGRKELGR